MYPFLRAAIEPSGLAFSVAMGLVVLYWLAVAVGLIDAEWLDRRLGRRLGGQTDGDALARPGRQAWRAELAKLPAMGWATLIASVLWLAMVPLAAVVNPYGRWHLGAGVALAALAAAAAALRWLGPPLGRWYIRSTRPAGAAESPQAYCRILSVQLASGQRGRAERLPPPPGTPAADNATAEAGGTRIDVIAAEGALLRQGQVARIDRYDADRQAYLVGPADPPASVPAAR